MADFYGPDLAAVQADAFEALAAAAAAQLLVELGAGAPGRRVIDLGCGAGPLSLRMLAHDFSAWGLDLSTSLVDLARAPAPQAQFECGSILDIALPSATAAAAVGEVLNYATASDRSALGVIFARVFAALEPGGLFLFDLAAPGRVGAGRAFTEGRDWAVGMIATEPDDHLTRRISIFRQARDGHWTRTHETHLLRLWPSDEVMAQLTANGFRVEQLSGYDGIDMPPALHVYLARKPG